MLFRKQSNNVKDLFISERFVFAIVVHSLFLNSSTVCFLDVDNFVFRIAIVKCLLVRNKNDDLFHINVGYRLENTLKDKAVLDYFHLDDSRSWTVSSIRDYLRQHHPDMLCQSPKTLFPDMLKQMKQSTLDTNANCNFTANANDTTLEEIVVLRRQA